MKSKDEIKKPIIYVSAVSYTDENVIEDLEKVFNGLEENPFVERYFTPYTAGTFTEGKPKELVTVGETHQMAYINGFNLEEADLIISLNYGLPTLEVGFAIAKGKPFFTYNPTDSALDPLIKANVLQELGQPEEVEEVNFIKLLND